MSAFRNRTRVLKIIISLLIFLPHVQMSLAARIEDHVIPETLTVGESELTLNGCGKREMLWSDLYLVSLYLTKVSTDAQAIMDDKASKAIRVEVLYDNDLPEDLPALWREPLQEEMSKEMLNAVLNLYDEISSGDIVLFKYHPQSGTRVTLNEERMIQRDNSLLVNTLLDNWIGDEPVSENLKRLLLGQSCQ